MPAPVQINFRVGGVAEVKTAFKTVQDVLEKAEREKTTAAKKSAKERISAEDSVTKAALKEIKDRHAGVKAEFKARNALNDLFISEFKLNEKRATDTVATEANKRDAIDNSSHRKRITRINEYHRALGRGMASGVSKVGGMAMNTMRTAMSIGGGFDIADSAQRAASASGTAADISNSGYIKGDTHGNGARRDPNEILAKSRAVGTEFGFESSDVLQGMQGFTAKTGDLKTGMESMRGFAELARATGASMSDVAEAAGYVSNNLGDIPNKSQVIMETMRGIAAQGKIGTVEIKDMASQMSKIAAAAGQMGGGSENILKMGMLSQVAASGGGAPSAANAATAAMGIINTLKTPARIQSFKNEGINVFETKNGVKQVRDPTEIIKDALVKTNADPLRMKKMFANIIGAKPAEAFGNIYRKAEGEQKGSGLAAVQAEMDRFTQVMSEAEVTESAKVRMQREDMQMAQVKADFDKAVATQVLPELIKLAPAIKDLVPLFTEMVSTGIPAFRNLIQSIVGFGNAHADILKSLAAHPVGAIIAAEIAKSMATSAMSSALSNGMSGALSKATFSIPQMSLLGAVALTAGAITMALVDDDVEAKAREQRALSSGNAESTNIMTKLHAQARSGEVDPATIKEAERILGDRGTSLKKINDPQVIHGPLEAMADFVSGGEIEEANLNKQAQQSKLVTSDMNDLIVSIQEAKKAFDEVAAQQRMNPNANPTNKPARSVSLAQ